MSTGKFEKNPDRPQVYVCGKNLGKFLQIHEAYMRIIKTGQNELRLFLVYRMYTMSEAMCG